GYGCFV
ncbi:hypothetical protein VCHC17A1_3351B, partial [Vibrio cholerae HC-17A1]